MLEKKILAEIKLKAKKAFDRKKAVNDSFETYGGCFAGNIQHLSRKRPPIAAAKSNVYCFIVGSNILQRYLEFAT